MKSRYPIYIVASLLLAPIVSSCNSSTTAGGLTTTTTMLEVTHNPVTDLASVAKSLGATDRSYVSVDYNGLYAVVVADQFHFLKYMTTGWMDVTDTLQINSPSGQQIDGLPVEKAISVTTRDYTGDRESDFLVTFGSGYAKYGAIVSASKGVLGFKTFCLLHDSGNRPGVLRTPVVENLQYLDEYKMLQGDNYDSDGQPLNSYWYWRKASRCFADTTLR